MRDKLQDLLAQLRFHGMAAALDGEIERAEREATPASELLYRLLCEEAASRRQRSLAYRLDQARLPWPWTLDTFPFERQPGVNKGQIKSLAELEFLRRADNVLLIGPPGTGKTTIARVVAKIYCGLGILKKENIKEVHRADLIGQHIGETEAKTNAIIDSALDGVLFLDEAYALVATGAKNDFGLVAIDTLLARMENDRDRLVVIIAGYRADLDRFLDTNQGLRSRFTRTIDFPSYQPAELIEIANFMAKRRDSAFEQPALDDLQSLFAHLAEITKPDTAGVERRGLDIAGNGRFVRNVVEKSEEEREFRLDHSEHAQTGEFTDEELVTITASDVANTVPQLLEGLRLEMPA